MKSELLVLGGGATGLVSALIAAKAGQQVTVIEGSPSFGGLLGTFPVGGTRLEHFYHHFFTHDAELAWLIRELGISDYLEYLPASMGIFRGGKIYPFNGPKDLLRFSPLSLISKARFGLSSLYLGKRMDWRTAENTSAVDWFYKHAGREATDTIWRPMLTIKFGPFADRVPVSWMVGRLRQRMNSRHKGDERLGYVRGSLQRVLDSLLGALERLGVTLVPNAKLLGLSSEDGKVTGAFTTRGHYEGNKILSTLPTNVLPPFVSGLSPSLAKKLEEIEYFGAVCTILEMDRPLSDVYWLNVADPGFPFGGVIEHTNFIPSGEYQGRSIAYLSRYFEKTNALATKSEGEIGQEMIRELPRIFPKFRPEHILNIHVFRTLTAATVCDLNFSRKVPKVRTELSNLFIASMAHVYPDERSLNNSVRVAAEACRVIGIPGASEVPKGSSLSGQIGT